MGLEKKSPLLTTPNRMKIKPNYIANAQCIGNVAVEENGKNHMGDEKNKWECTARNSSWKRVIENIENRKKKWLGHIMRGNSLYLTVIEGKLEGRRGRGRIIIIGIRATLLGNLGEEDRMENWKGWQKTEKDGGCQTCRRTCQR